MNYNKKALELHKNLKGKIEVISKVKIENPNDLTLSYTPGVAAPCLEIKNNKNDVYKYTSKGNMIAVISDGSAVLGLGDIGPYAGIPVMEGKAILFKRFANIDAVPICLDTKDCDEIIKTIVNISPSFGGINLEDISAPRCVYIERKLKELLDIPVFHDDQHGTAIVIGAAIINGCKLSGKSIDSLTVVISGTGAAGSSIARHLKKLGVKKIYAYNLQGVVDKDKYETYDFLIKELIDDCIIDSKEHNDNTLASLIKDADCFIGVSAPNIVTKEMIKSMNTNPFVFALANPNPEISYNDAKEAGAYIIGTGRSDYPNQVNNILAFPGIFRGALDSRTKSITDEIKIAASYAIADVISENELTPAYIIPSPFDERVVPSVAKAVKDLVSKGN